MNVKDITKATVDHIRIKLTSVIFVFIIQKVYSLQYMIDIIVS